MRDGTVTYTLLFESVILTYTCMTGRTHDVAAFTALVLVITYLPSLPVMSLPTAMTAFAANFMGGLFPDIDQPTSDFWDNFRLGPVLAKIICPAFGGHRHISHSLFGLVTIGLAAKFLLYLLAPIVLLDMNIIWWAFMIGVVSHLFMDLFTKEGLPLLWPVPWKFGFPPLKVLRVETGKFLESLLIFPGLLLFTGYFIYLHQQKFLELLHLITGR